MMTDQPQEGVSLLSQGNLPSASPETAETAMQVVSQCSSLYAINSHNAHALSALPKPGEFLVDVVYTWLAQPSQEELNTLIKDCPRLEGGMRRVRDANTLRFSLQMLEQNIPWVRKVFIVVGREAPDWLNT